MVTGVIDDIKPFSRKNRYFCRGAAAEPRTIRLGMTEVAAGGSMAALS
jgi:hypothetical protein